MSLDRLRTIIDYNPMTGMFCRKITRGNQIAGSEVGCMHLGYRRISIDRKHYEAHRLAWFMTYGRWPEKQIDHINGNRSDNRIANLREANKAQNNRNNIISKNNKSGYNG